MDLKVRDSDSLLKEYEKIFKDAIVKFSYFERLVAELYPKVNLILLIKEINSIWSFYGIFVSNYNILHSIMKPSKFVIN